MNPLKKLETVQPRGYPLRIRVRFPCRNERPPRHLQPTFWEWTTSGSKNLDLCCISDGLRVYGVRLADGIHTSALVLSGLSIWPNCCEAIGYTSSWFLGFGPGFFGQVKASGCALVV